MENETNLNELLSEDLQGNEKLQEIGDVNKLANSYLELQSKMGSISEKHQKELENKIEIPGEDADEETLNQFYQKLGRPETPDDYSDVELDGVPEGVQLDEDTLKAIKKASYEAGVPDSQYKKVMTEIAKQQLVSLDNFVKEDEAREKESKEQLIKEWGGEEQFGKKLELAKRLVRHYDGEESELVNFLDNTRLGHYAPLIRMLGNLASDIMAEEVTFKGESGSMAKEKEIELSPTTGRPMLSYDKSPELQ